jgi:hypothetical protein
VGDPLALLLLILGAGFLVANLLIMADVWRHRRRRATAVLTWSIPRPRPASLPVWIAAGLGLLVAYKLVILRWPASAVFGEGMMFLYYAVWYPMSFTVERGFYGEGIWLDRRFVRYVDVTGLSWREEPGAPPRLLVVAGRRQQAGHLTVPPPLFGEVRRLLRDRIGTDQVHMKAPLLALGGHDRREDV